MAAPMRRVCGFALRRSRYWEAGSGQVPCWAPGAAGRSGSRPPSWPGAGASRAEGGRLSPCRRLLLPGVSLARSALSPWPSPSSGSPGTCPLRRAVVVPRPAPAAWHRCPGALGAPCSLRAQPGRGASDPLGRCFPAGGTESRGRYQLAR